MGFFFLNLLWHMIFGNLLFVMMVRPYGRNFKEWSTLTLDFCLKVFHTRILISKFLLKFSSELFIQYKEKM